MNHVICIPLFGKQESQELILESWNQAKIPKDSESRRRNSQLRTPRLWDTHELILWALTFIGLKSSLLVLCIKWSRHCLQSTV